MQNQIFSLRDRQRVLTSVIEILSPTNKTPNAPAPLPPDKLTWCASGCYRQGYAAHRRKNA